MFPSTMTMALLKSCVIPDENDAKAWAVELWASCSSRRCSSVTSVDAPIRRVGRPWKSNSVTLPRS